MRHSFKILFGIILIAGCQVLSIESGFAGSDPLLEKAQGAWATYMKCTTDMNNQKTNINLWKGRISDIEMGKMVKELQRLTQLMEAAKMAWEAADAELKRANNPGSGEVNLGGRPDPGLDFPGGTGNGEDHGRNGEGREIPGGSHAADPPDNGEINGPPPENETLRNFRNGHCHDDNGYDAPC